MDPAYAALLDDAAVFPPGNLPLPDAVTAHEAHHRSRYADLVGPLVLPGAALSGLALLVGDEPVAVSVTLTGTEPEVAAAVSALDALPTARLAAVEAVLPDATDPADVLAVFEARLPDGALGYLEVPRDDRAAAVLDALAGTRWRAKFRTGGVLPEAHPGEGELAASLAAAVGRGVPFKCTAGLHHAVRHTDGDLDQHGFLNVLLATEAARDGAGPDDLAALLALRTPDEVADRVRAVPAGRLAAARDSFVSFGTCSVADPLRDLISLGLLPGSVAA